MPIPIAKEQKDIKQPQVGEGGAQLASKVMPVDTGLPQSVQGAADSIIDALSVYKKTEIDNATVRAGQLNLQLGQQLQDLMNSTDTDENGEVIGFLHREGQDAFNSLPQLDKRIAGVYNSYLKEMSQLPPVAIEKLLLQGKELVSNTQKQAFNYSYEQHKKYNINNAKALMDNTVVNANGSTDTNGSIDDNFRNSADIVKRCVEIMNDGQSDEVLANETRKAMNLLVTNSLNETSNKYSDIPTLGGGSTVATRQLKNIFKEGYIDKETFNKELKALDKDVCGTAVNRSGPSNYKQAIKVIMEREGLTTLEKEEYIKQLDSKMKTLAKDAKQSLDDGVASTDFIVVNSLPHAYEAKTILTEFGNNPKMFRFNEKGDIEIFDTDTDTIMSFDTWVNRRDLGGILNDKYSMDILKDKIYYIQNLKNSGMGDKDWNKFNSTLKKVFESGMTRDEQIDTKANEEKIGDAKYNHASSFYNSSDSRKNAEDKAAEKNYEALNGASYTSMNNVTNTDSKKKLDIAASNMLRDAFAHAISVTSGKDMWEQVDKALSSVNEDFSKDKNALMFHERNSFVEFLTDRLKEYNKGAKREKGFYVKIPAGKDEKGNTLYENFLYQGNIDYGEIMADVYMSLINDNRFKGVQGGSISDKTSNMDSNTEQYVYDMINKKVTDKIMAAVTTESGRTNTESLTTGQVLSSEMAGNIATMRIVKPKQVSEGLVVPFDKDATQLIKLEKNDYKNFSTSMEQLEELPEAKQNLIVGTYERIVDTDKITKITPKQIDILGIAFGRFEKNGLPTPAIGTFKIYDFFDNTQKENAEDFASLLGTISDIQSGRAVNKNYTEKKLTTFIDKLQNSYKDKYNSNLRTDFSVYQNEKGSIHDFEDSASYFGSGMSFNKSNQELYDKAYYYSAFNTLYGLLQELSSNNTTMYLDRSAYNKVQDVMNKPLYYDGRDTKFKKNILFGPHMPKSKKEPNYLYGKK